MSWWTDVRDAVSSVVSGAANIAIAPVKVPFVAAKDIFIDGKPVAEAAGRGLFGTSLATGGQSGIANFALGGVKLAQATPGVNKVAATADKLTFGGVSDLKSSSNLITKLGTADNISRGEALEGTRGTIWTGARIGAVYGISEALAANATATAVGGKAALDIAKGNDPITAITNAFAPSAAPLLKDAKDIIAPYQPVIDAASQFFPTETPGQASSGPAQNTVPVIYGDSGFATTKDGLSGAVGSQFIPGVDNTITYLAIAALGMGALLIARRRKS